MDQPLTSCTPVPGANAAGICWPAPPNRYRHSADYLEMLAEEAAMPDGGGAPDPGHFEADRAADRHERWMEGNTP